MLLQGSRDADGPVDTTKAMLDAQVHVYMHLNTNTSHCTTLQLSLSLSLFLPFSVTLFIVPFSPSHTHSCIPPQLFTLDRHCTELEKQDGEQMNPSNDIYVIMIWGIQREEPKVFIDGKEHLGCNGKDNGSIGTNCAIDSYRITYSYLPVSDLQIMYW